MDFICYDSIAPAAVRLLPKFSVAFRPTTSRLEVESPGPDSNPPIVFVDKISVDLCQPYTKDFTTENWLSIVEAALPFPQLSSIIFDFKDAGSAHQFMKMHRGAVQRLHEVGKLKCTWGTRDNKRQINYAASLVPDVLAQ